MFVIENYGFFIFLIVIILIIFYFQNGQCFDLRKNIREGFDNFRENFSNGSNINTTTTTTTSTISTITKEDINFGGEMFMALNSCPTFYVKLYWKLIYGHESRVAKFASNIIRKAEDGFKARAQKIFAKISSVIGF